MATTPLIVEIICTFFLAATLLYRYGNWFRHHIIVTGAVLLAWYFSFLIAFLLPLDVTSTVYRQCLEENRNSTPISREVDFDFPTNDTALADISNFTISTTPADWVSNGSEIHCREPWSYVPPTVMPHLWRVVYWTSQFLTWLVLPLMQSYSKAGNFTIKGKLRSAIRDNLIYYGSYLLIVCVLLIYLFTKPEFTFDWPKLKAIAASASNTWGLFWLVLLLGYGLVDVPRSLWNRAKRGYTLNHLYFKASKLNTEKSCAEENLEDNLDALQAAANSIHESHSLRLYVETIQMKVPVEMRERVRSRVLASDNANVVPSEASLVRLHRQVMKALQTHHRTETQWENLVEKIVDMEDIIRNEGSHEHYFKATFPKTRTGIYKVLHSSRLEWFWKCRLEKYVLRFLALTLAILSGAVVWSELTFFKANPTLSLFAIFVDKAKESYDYHSIELVSIFSIAYLCICAYSTVFKIRFLDIYYLASHHQTDEYSLIFSGMMLCRLTPAMCLNFLGLIHMDSHVIKTRIMETYYTQIMGHMDVLYIISDGFNIYFPMAILVLCLATYFSLGARLLSLMGFQQFVGDEEITSDLVEEGKELIRREKRKRQRFEDAQNRKREYQTRTAERANRYREVSGLLQSRDTDSDAPLQIQEDEDERLDSLFMARGARNQGRIHAEHPSTFRSGHSTNYSNLGSTYTRPNPNLFDDV
nr:EOG090X03B7 [Lepidurus arcticus]